MAAIGTTVWKSFSFEVRRWSIFASLAICLEATMYGFCCVVAYKERVSSLTGNMATGLEPSNVLCVASRYVLCFLSACGNAIQRVEYLGKLPVYAAPGDCLQSNWLQVWWTVCCSCISEQVTILIPNLTAEEMESPDRDEIIDQVHNYNRRFSGEPRPVSSRPKVLLGVWQHSNVSSCKWWKQDVLT